jgi:hypothetical protein
MRRFVFVLGVCFAFFVFDPFAYANIRYDGYFGNVVGSSRVIGLGGAYRSVAEGSEGSIYNPAGLSFMDSWWDFDLSFGQYKQRFKSYESFVPINDDSFHFHLGGAFKVSSWRDFAFGLSIYQPHHFSFNSEEKSELGVVEDVAFELSYLVFALPVSMKLFENFSAGLTARASGSNMRFSSTNNSEKTADAYSFGFDLGLKYRWNEKQAYSFTYHFTDRGRFDRSLPPVEGFVPFRPVARPHRVYLGSSYSWSPKFRSMLDFGVIFGMRNTFVPASQLTSELDGIESGRRLYPVYHLGAEYLFLPGRFEGRMGHYYQPPRSKLDSHRFHLTGGLDFYFWYLRLGTAIDWARDYYYFTVGLSPSFAHRSRR